MDAWSLMRGDAFIHFVSGSRRVNIRLGVLLLIPKSPHYTPEEARRGQQPCYSNSNRNWNIDLTTALRERFDWSICKQSIAGLNSLLSISKIDYLAVLMNPFSPTIAKGIRNGFMPLVRSETQTTSSRIFISLYPHK